MQICDVAPPALRTSSGQRFSLSVASRTDREVIYRLRHDVYARELGQHEVRPEAKLRDPLDDHNVYIVAKCGVAIAGFISLTPANAPTFSIDKYFSRSDMPIPFDGKPVEIRLLTVRKEYRGTPLAFLLMYGALRWTESHGATHVVALGRREIVDLYERVGFTWVGRSVLSGRVTYHLMHAEIAEMRQRADSTFASFLDRSEESTAWRLSFPFRKPAPCFHGGAFFTAIGERFDCLERHKRIINADVLDAWFPPSPKVVAALKKHLPWLLRTSPPTACEGLIETIAVTRGVALENILPSAGSSDLIFRAFRQCLTARSHALILDPTYGEYAHVLEKVIGCTVDRLKLSRDNGYEVDPQRLRAALDDSYDLVVIVNPNSPTGRHLAPETLQPLLREAPPETRIWIDETYVEYAGPNESLEQFAAASENVIVCKSMSKVYALSGARVAYLCAGPHQLEALRAITPPWVVGLPSQLAAVRALQDPDYYNMRYEQTRQLRAQLATRLTHFGWSIVPGIANFLLCQLPANGPDASTIVRRCRDHGLFLRDAAGMGTDMGSHSLRIAVKDLRTNEQMLRILERVLRSAAP
jgi:histidinol-phosphate/aromatic aminotransferase/cobyric acid decarboxylase-like protein/GNAT superfamily N-acetyltransferase